MVDCQSAAFAGWSRVAPRKIPITTLQQEPIIKYLPATDRWQTAVKFAPIVLSASAQKKHARGACFFAK